MPTESVKKYLSTAFGGRPVVLIGSEYRDSALAALQLGAQQVLVMLELGADPHDVMPGLGVGVWQGAKLDPLHTMVDTSRQIRRLPLPSGPAPRDVHHFDPMGRALVLTPSDLPYIDTCLWGRRVMAGNDNHAVLDDKTRVDEAVFIPAGVHRLQTRNFDKRAIAAARYWAESTFGEEARTVWSGDPWGGRMGGAGVRFAPTTSDIPLAIEGIYGSPIAVRGSEWADGVSIGIPLLVHDHGTEVFDPNELLIHTTNSYQPHDNGIATTWIPTPEVHRKIVEAGQKIGNVLAGPPFHYRGFVSLNAKVNQYGVFPHEINGPRFCHGLVRLNDFSPVDLRLLHAVMRANRSIVNLPTPDFRDLAETLRRRNRETPRVDLIRQSISPSRPLPMVPGPYVWSEEQWRPVDNERPIRSTQPTATCVHLDERTIGFQIDGASLHGRTAAPLVASARTLLTGVNHDPLLGTIDLHEITTTPEMTLAR